MENTSARDLISESESSPELPLGELLRLDRRRFLRNGALTAAGLAALSGVELVMPAIARAQSSSSPVQNLELLAASIDPIPAIFPAPAPVCHHVYRYLYRFQAGEPQSIPPDLEVTYRLNGGAAFPTAVPGSSPADRLQPTLALAPFTNPGAAPANLSPGLARRVAWQRRLLRAQPVAGASCYRLTQQVDALTLQVYEMVQPQLLPRQLHCHHGRRQVPLLLRQRRTGDAAAGTEERGGR